MGSEEREMMPCNGSCHCGGLTVVAEFAADTRAVQPRQCDCAFCTKHGALYVSDPLGNLTIVERRPGSCRDYRQGSNTARFILCGHCGVLMAVLFDHPAGICGAVNLRCFDSAPDFGPPIPVSPSLLPVNERTQRWRELWFPQVSISTGVN